MARLKLDVSQGLAVRIARACTRTLTFTQPAASLLVKDPPQAGGLLAGVAGGLAGSSGELLNRAGTCDLILACIVNVPF